MKNELIFSKKIVITAGPTREAIDPVRFISNHSTGKMGYAIAEYLHSKGAQVTVVSGPVNLKTSLPSSAIVNVVSADEMLEATQKLALDADVIIFSAAVADYKCEHIATQKIKKKENSLQLNLVPNVDIAFTVSQNKREEQIFIGFALETENGIENAISKLRRKKFDSVVLNLQTEAGSGFGHDTNRIQIVNSDETIIPFEQKLKTEVAVDIANHIVHLLEEKSAIVHHA
jgi:phosphopantothenoylcysteine decarboxylase/phosphopantothenate--cysteine ligase